MSLGAELVIAFVGLWGVFMRPIMFQYALRMGEVMICTIHQIIREWNSLVLTNYISY